MLAEPQGTIAVRAEGVSETDAHLAHLSSPQRVSQPLPSTPSVPPPTILADWQTGLFDCDEYIPSSMDAFLCPHCVSSAHFGVLYQGTSGIYFPVCGGLVCADLCWLFAFKCLCAVQLHTMLVRRELRRRYNIWQDADDCTQRCCRIRSRSRDGPQTTASTATSGATQATDGVYGDARVQLPPAAPTSVIVVGGCRQLAVDVLVAMCCTPCAVGQHHRELTAQGVWPGAVVFSRDPPLEESVVPLNPPGLSATR